MPCAALRFFSGWVASLFYYIRNITVRRSLGQDIFHQLCLFVVHNDIIRYVASNYRSFRHVEVIPLLRIRIDAAAQSQERLDRLSPSVPTNST
jgi:hypothetical protein